VAPVKKAVFINDILKIIYIMPGYFGS